MLHYCHQNWVNVFIEQLEKRLPSNHILCSFWSEPGHNFRVHIGRKNPEDKNLYIRIIQRTIFWQSISPMKAADIILAVYLKGKN